MLGVRWLLGIAFLGIGAAATPAYAADGVEFLDNRPIVVDLDLTQVRQQWRVRVLDGQSGGAHNLTLHVVFQPAGVIAIVGSATRRTSQGEVAEFVFALHRRAEGSGELVVASGGAIARRQISTTLDAGLDSVALGSLQFAGVQLVPFTGQVRVGGLNIRDAPGGTELPRRMGVLTSASGDLADVIRRGDDFFVQGANGVGEYVGSLDLLPDREGGEVDATLRVRDLPAWPLLVLLLGLAVVQTLDRYQRRLRPRRLLELRLARLRDRARAIERETDLALRVCAMPGDPALLLDKLVAEALAAAGQHMTDEERAAWEPDGSEFKRLTDVLESFRQVGDSFRAVRAQLESIVHATERMDRERARRALVESVASGALRGRGIETAVDLRDTAARLEDASTYLDDFRRIYRTLVRLRNSGAPDVHDQAVRILTKLFQAPDDLAGVDAETAELHRRWQPAAPGPVPPAPVAVGADRAQARPPGRYRAEVRGGRRGRVLPVALAASAAVITSVAVFSLAGGVDPGVSPHPTSSPTSSPSARPTPTTSPVLPEAPVGSAPQAPVARGFEVRQPSAAQIMWFGVVLPLLLLALLGAAAWLVLRSWRQRRAPRTLADLDTSAIDREVRIENVRFSLVSGALVVLSGMSLLYVGNPTFGSPGHYLTVALWGTAVGEGLHLARRLLPFPSMT